VYNLERTFNKAVEEARAEGLGDEVIREHLRKQVAKYEARAGEEPRGRVIRITVTDRARVEDSVEVTITREKLAAAVALTLGVDEEEGAKIADELLETMVAA